LDLSGAKALAGALAIGGTRSFFLGRAFEWNDGSRERVVVDETMLRRWREAMPREDDPDAICIGCPHLSEKELLRLANAMDGRRAREGPDVFFLTSQLAWDKSPRPALVLQKIGAACCDSCPRLGIPAGHERIVTNGTRLCDCMAGTGPTASFAPLDEIITMLQG
jgi:predicted aconitase